jgi:hypothetical protein
LLLLCSFAAKPPAAPLALQASKMLINRSEEWDLATGLEFEAHFRGYRAHARSD